MKRAARAWLLLLATLTPMATSSQTPPVPALAFDAQHSGASFLVQLRTGSRIEGRIISANGDLSGTADSSWKVRVKLDGRSLRVDGPRWMERVTRSDSFLAVNRYPVIRFESEAFTDALLRGGGALPGRLSLRGLVQAVSFQLLPSACDRPGLACDINVQGRLSRQAFGMTAYRALLKDSVEVRFRVRLRPAPGPR
jgi:polyisoprenoid-binding protein YceI